MGELIPIIALAIPLAAVTGKFIVQPVIQAVLRMSEQRGVQDSNALQQRLAVTEERMEQLERTLRQIGEEQDFQRRLLAGRATDARDVGRAERTGP